MEGRLKILAVIHTIVEHEAGFVNLFTIMMGKTPRFLRKKAIYRLRKILYNGE